MRQFRKNKPTNLILEGRGYASWWDKPSFRSQDGFFTITKFLVRPLSPKSQYKK